jgi:site-specific DNA-methyltransferase (adenine-specific)
MDIAVDIDGLTLDPDNARSHPSVSVDGIAQSFKRFGQRKPVVVRKDGSVVKAGNGMVRAARQLGWGKIAAVVVDEDASEADAFALADNRTAELSVWDQQVLVERLAAVEAPEELGWSEDELAHLLREVNEPPPPGQGDGQDPRDKPPEVVDPITEAGEVVELGPHTLHCADCVEVLRGLPDNSADACVTDPPYGIGFMGKGWDSDLPQGEFAAELFRVLKPGAHAVLFAATRTIHRLGVMLEDAGFEVRDQIGWLQWQGFPKSLDVSKAIESTLVTGGSSYRQMADTREAAGAATTGGGAHAFISHPGTRQGQYRNKPGSGGDWSPATAEAKRWQGWGTALKPALEPAILVRKPMAGTVAANVLQWCAGALNVDACRLPDGDPAWPGPQAGSGWETNRPDAEGEFLALPKTGPFKRSPAGRWPANIYHCAKPGPVEREGNTHATVKPVKLMRWLLRLVTPPGGLVLEPFAGSGTTLVAAHGLDLQLVASEREPAYCDIVRARWAAC